jgi:tetratricopeptide (TPR) repeat protein
MRPLALLLVLAACKAGPGAAFPAAFADAQRAESAGRYSEAAAKYEEAARVAQRDRDRDEAAYTAGLMYLRSGDIKKGIATLEKVKTGQHAAEAAQRVAMARIENGDPERGYQELEEVVAKYPDAGISRAAFRHLLARADARNEGMAWLRAKEAGPLGKSSMAELIAYRIAERMPDDAQNHDALLAVADRFPYPKGAFWDDALYHASEADERLGRYAHAIEDLERMLKERESTSLVGTYQRPRMAPALLRIAILYRDKIGDRKKARETFRRLYDELKHSTLRDDALWLEAEILEGDGDKGAACARLAALVSEFPDSRYVPCAEGKCGLSRTGKSKAPRECRPYLLRPNRIPD